MLNRVLAVVVALAMIGSAVVYRSSRHSASSGSGSLSSVPAAAGQIVCAAELGPDVCGSLPDGHVVEPAAATADRLAKARNSQEVGVAAWLAPGPWGEMVDAGRQGQPSLFRSKTSLAHTPLVAVARKGQLPPGCGSAVTWKCVGDAAQDPAFRLAGDQSTGTSVFLRAAAVGGFLSRTDYASNDLEGEASTWLGNVNLRLAAAPGFGAPSLAQFLINQGSARAFLTLGAAAAAAPGSSFDVVTPTPAAAIGAVLVRTSLPSAEISESAVVKALVGSGWEAGPLRGEDGLPSPGVLLALREML